MLTLYHAPRSRSSRFIWLLEELGVPYDITYVTIGHGDPNVGPDPKNVHPEGKVPALVHDGKLIMESGAICLYLTDAFPAAGIGPKIGDPTRADYLFWLFNNTSDLEPAMVARMMGRGDEPMQKRAYDQLIARLSKALGAGDYLLGDAFSAADIVIAANMLAFRKEFPDEPLYNNYLERLTARHAYSRAAAKEEG